MSKIDKQAAAIAAFHVATRKGRPREPRPVTMPSQPTAWDKGADGPANQHGLRVEPATDIDPETGKETANPNGIKRRRRVPWISVYCRQGHISHEHAAAAEKLLLAAEGMPERDPLAALSVKPTSGVFSPEVSRADARRNFWKLWAMVPTSSRPVVERVVLENRSIWGRAQDEKNVHFDRLRKGLEAIISA